MTKWGTTLPFLLNAHDMVFLFVFCLEMSMYFAVTYSGVCVCVSLPSQGSVCEVQRHALGSGGSPGPEGHQPGLSTHAGGGRRFQSL